MAARTGYAHVPKGTSQIKFISCIYNPTHLYGRESQRPNQRWKTLQLNPVRRTPLGRSFWSRIRHGSTDHFRREIRSRLELATTREDHDLTIDSGELYKS